MIGTAVQFNRYDYDMYGTAGRLYGWVFLYAYLEGRKMDASRCCWRRGGIT